MKAAQDDPMGELLRLIRDARARGFYLDDHDIRREIELLVDERQREVMALYWLRGLNQAQVAQQLGVSQQRVSAALTSGATNLAARLANLILSHE